MTARYTYGDTELAAERLGLVAHVFEPTTRALLERVVIESHGLAYDLGCGPGHTTRLVHEATGATRTVGLDRSGPFLDRTAQGASDGVRFLAHDVRVVPFPAGPADVVFCRLLLAHLADPAEVVARWTTQLRVDGTVLVDELEAIETDEPVFRAYLDDVDPGRRGAGRPADRRRRARGDARPTGLRAGLRRGRELRAAGRNERADLRDEPCGARGPRGDRPTRGAGEALLYGIKPVVVAIVAQGVWQLGRTTLRAWLEGAAARLAIVAYVLGTPVLLVLLGGAFAVSLARNRHRLLGGTGGSGSALSLNPRSSASSVSWAPSSSRAAPRCRRSSSSS